MKHNPILTLLIAFSTGIILANIVEAHWIIVLSLWLISLLLLILLNHFKRKAFAARKWISLSIMTVFFFSGALGYKLKDPASFDNEFSVNYLLNDYLIGEIVDFQEGKNDYDRAIIEVSKIQSKNIEKNVQGRLLCYIQTQELNLNEGVIIRFQPELNAIKNKNNPGEFNAKRYWAIQGIEYISFIQEESIEIINYKPSFHNFWSKARAHLVALIKTRISEANQGLVIGLSLGDKSSLSIETKNQFTNAGAMHVLAVSGMHVGILLGFIQFFFKRIKILRRRNLYLYFALIFLWSFALITGLPASVSRAVLMFSILAIGQLAGKKFFSLQAIFGSALILLIINPMWLFDIGFQLSYLAVLSIGLFYQPINKLYRSKNKLINWFWQGTAIGIAAQIGTVPLSLIYFHQFPNYFFLSNLGLLFLASGALISVVLFLLLHFVPYLVDLLSFIVEIVFTALNLFISWINTLPAVISTGFTPHLSLIILFYLGIIFSLHFWKKGDLKLIKLSFLSLLICSFALIINRENNKYKEELVVLNHYEKLILIKSNRKLFLCYDNRRPISMEKLRFVIQGYETATGVNAKAIPLPYNSRVKLSDKASISNLSEGFKIHYYDKKIFLANKINTNILNSDYQIIKGEWNKYLSEEDVSFNTMEGALVIKP